MASSFYLCLQNISFVTELNLMYLMIYFTIMFYIYFTWFNICQNTEFALVIFSNLKFGTDNLAVIPF